MRSVVQFCGWRADVLIEMKVLAAAIVVVIAVCGSCSGVWGQTTKPAPAPFAELVQTLGEALVNGEARPVTDALAEEVTIEGFGETNQTVDRLVHAADDATLVSFRAYGQTPSCLASDLAEDFEKAKDIPETVRREMMPGSEAITRANVTAAQWIMQTLDPGRKHMIGVIVVCPRPAPTPINVRPTPVKPIFVLIKGEMEGGKVRIKQIVYGNPLEQQE